MSIEIDQAVAILKAGGLVAFPTETVYGLGADARNENAVRKVFAAKERPFDHPLIVHIAHFEQLADWAVSIPPTAYQLAQAFWPGPLTLVLNKKSHVWDCVTGGQNTVAIRIPKHPIAAALLKAFGDGIVAPSANKFTHISPTTANAVKEELGKKVDLILDGGACEVGVESTIVDLSQDTIQILRPGMISSEAISKVLGKSVLLQNKPESRTPGMHELHYAPTTKTRFLSKENCLGRDDSNVGVIFYSNLNIPASITQIKLPQNPEQYAHEIYRALRNLDHQNLNTIYIEEVPDGFEWEGIRDRLNKATCKR